MRRNLSEAPRKKTARFELTADIVYGFAMKVAGELQRNSHEFGRPWSHDWINAVTALMQKSKANHEAIEAKEKADAERYGDTYAPTPFDLNEALADAMARWWDEKKIRLTDTGSADEDVKYRMKEYFRRKPDVEDSDALTILQAEKELASAVDLSGGFGSLGEMMKVLHALDSFAHTLLLTQDHSASFCDSTRIVIDNGLPLILWFCKAMGARKQVA